MGDEGVTIWTDGWPRFLVTTPQHGPKISHLSVEKWQE